VGLKATVFFDAGFLGAALALGLARTTLTAFFAITILLGVSMCAQEYPTCIANLPQVANVIGGWRHPSPDKQNRA
jgi:hypothetical protein